MPLTTKKEVSKEMRLFFKKHLTKGTKTLRKKTLKLSVKCIRIKHYKHMHKFDMLLQTRPHCHLLNKDALSYGLVYTGCFLNIHSEKCDQSSPILRAVWQHNSQPPQ